MRTFEITYMLHLSTGFQIPPLLLTLKIMLKLTIIILSIATSQCISLALRAYTIKPNEQYQMFSAKVSIAFKYFSTLLFYIYS